MNKENASKLWKIIQEKLVIILGVRGTHWLTLSYTSYAGHLTFIKNKSLKDSSI